MYELKKIGKLFTSKSVGTGPSSYKKRIYRAAVFRRLRNTGLTYMERTVGRADSYIRPLLMDNQAGSHRGSLYDGA